MLRLIIGFLPWIIFGVLGKRHFLLALILALAVSAVTAVRRAGHAAECWLTSATLIRGPSSCHDGTSWTGSRKLGPGRRSYGAGRQRLPHNAGGTAARFLVAMRASHRTQNP